jgi:hypothetical protein
LYRIVKSNCSSKIFNIIKSYFENRELIVKSCDKIINRKMSKGSSQESILGPTIWNMVMDSLLNEETEGCEYIAYADDLALVIKRNSRKELETIAGEVFNKIEDWTEINKLEISTEKTKAILFKGKLDKEMLLNLKYKDNRIKYYDTIRYLGLILDKKLNFIEHAKYCDVMHSARRHKGTIPTEGGKSGSCASHLRRGRRSASHPCEIVSLIYMFCPDMC